MAYIEWDNALYSVNVEKFDEHHKKIVDFINQLHEAMMQGKGKDILQTILVELKEYTEYHFSEEEIEMGNKNYPELEQHKKLHKELIQQLSELIEKHKQGAREVSIETFKFLKEWLFSHIQGTDKKYSPYMRQYI